MIKNLAIKGHPTRGKEVIELLEMMGGKNIHKYDGEDNAYSYYLYDYAILNDMPSILEDDDFEIFTLQEFLEKFPYKVGDVIKFPNNMAEEIAEMKWDEELKDVIYTSVSGCTRPSRVPKNTNKTKVETTGFMQFGKTFAVIFNDANYEDEVELQLGDYEIEVRDGKTYAVRKKTVFPKTYEECCQYLGCDDRLSTGKLVLLKQLINARNAYWKIAGEQMGLDKPWKPDWNDAYCSKYFITFVADEVNMDFSNVCNYILAFPTEEMRDAFYENFKNMIEQCKEFL